MKFDKTKTTKPQSSVLAALRGLRADIALQSKGCWLGKSQPN